MSTIQLHQRITLIPSEHDRRRSQANVMEGSGGIWESLHYDSSDRNHVVLTTTDSNTWGDASGHTYTFTSRPDGLMVVVREGKNLKAVSRLRARVDWRGDLGEGVCALRQSY